MITFNVHDNLNKFLLDEPKFKFGKEEVTVDKCRVVMDTGSSAGKKKGKKGTTKAQAKAPRKRKK